jgi:hypothetical protein
MDCLLPFLLQQAQHKKIVEARYLNGCLNAQQQAKQLQRLKESNSKDKNIAMSLELRPYGGKEYQDHNSKRISYGRVKTLSDKPSINIYNCPAQSKLI